MEVKYKINNVYKNKCNDINKFVDNFNERLAIVIIALEKNK